MGHFSTQWLVPNPSVIILRRDHISLFHGIIKLVSLPDVFKVNQYPVFLIDIIVCDANHTTRIVCLLSTQRIYTLFVQLLVAFYNVNLNVFCKIVYRNVTLKI